MGKREMTFNEQRVLDVLNGRTFVKGRVYDQKRELSIAEMATRGFPHVRPVARAQSWVRNALRTLVALELATQVGRGTYEVTLKGTTSAPTPAIESEVAA